MQRGEVAVDMFRLDGKVVVVTGAGKGIGRGIALALAEAGARVAIMARTATDVDSAVAEIVGRGGMASGVQGDVTVEQDLGRLLDEAVGRYGRLDAWVSNAGGITNAATVPLRELTSAHWDALMDVNLKAMWRSCVVAADALEAGGSIVAISSRSAMGGFPGLGAYAAAKAAVNSLVQTFAKELGPRLRVNAIAPGPVLTPNLQATLSLEEEDIPDLLGTLGVTMGRLGTPADIGAAAVYLISPAASWVTGQCLYVTGGR